jgi:hypothetical protein
MPRLKTCTNCKAFNHFPSPHCDLDYKPRLEYVKGTHGILMRGFPTEPCEKPTTYKELVSLQLTRQRNLRSAREANQQTTEIP